MSIFVVDDEEIITRSLSLILRREGFVVTSFTNPLNALKRIQTTAQEFTRRAPNLLISDVMMPELSGIDLAMETRKWLPDCKILLFSGAADQLLLQAGEDGLDFRLLQKPLHPSNLLLEIEALTESSPDPC
jgi:CheY-like chemotaxis protein